VSFFLAQRPLPTSFSGFPRCHSIWLNARDYAAQALVLKYINEGDIIEAAKWAGMIEDEQLSKRMKKLFPGKFPIK